MYIYLVGVYIKISKIVLYKIMEVLSFFFNIKLFYIFEYTGGLSESLFLGLQIVVVISQFPNVEAVVSSRMFYSQLAPISVLNPFYVTGFVDGEGCFFVGISPDSRSSTGYRVKLTFQLGLHEKDLALLELIK